MPVLVEACSVIIQASAIAAKYRGGWPRFQHDVPNSTLCFDGELARVGFMTPPDFIAYIDLLEVRGLQHLDGDRAVDLAVVNMLDEPEILHACDWLEFHKMELDDGGRVAACRLAGSDSEELAVPDGWTGPVEMMYLPPEETSARMRLQRRRPNGVEVFEDRTTGREWYAGRTTDEPVPGEEEFIQPSRPAESGDLYEDGTPYVKQIREGSSREQAIAALVDACNRRNTLFLTERLIEDSLPTIERYLGENISAEEAAALRDLASKQSRSNCVMAWLVQRPAPWGQYARGAGQRVRNESESAYPELGVSKEALPGYQAAKARLQARAENLSFCADCGSAARWIFLGYGVDPRLNIGWVGVCDKCRTLVRALGESPEPKREKRLRALLREYWRE